MKSIISMGTLVFIVLAIALAALITSMFNAVQLKNIKPQVTVIEKPVATQSAVSQPVVTASPSASPTKRPAVVTKPPVSVSPTVAE